MPNPRTTNETRLAGTAPTITTSLANVLDATRGLDATGWNTDSALPAEAASVPSVTARQFSSEAGNGTRSREDTIKLAAWLTHYASQDRRDTTAVLRGHGIARVNATDREMYDRELALGEEFKNNFVASLGQAMFAADGGRDQGGADELTDFYLQEACGITEKLFSNLSRLGFMVTATHATPVIREGY